MTMSPDTQAYIAEVAKRRCSNCGTLIRIIPLPNNCTTFEYPCPCSKDPGKHPLIRIWQEKSPGWDEPGV